MKKQMKIALTTAGCCLLLAPAAMAGTTQVYYDNTLLPTSAPIMTVSDRTMMGFRDLFDGLQVAVNWDETTRTATATYGTNEIVLMPDTQKALLNGKEQTLDAPPTIINDRVYVPLRFVAQSLGAEVSYTAKNGNATIQISSLTTDQNQGKKEGNLTMIPRQAQDAVESNATYDYAVASNGNLIQVIEQTGSIIVNSINSATGNITTQQVNKDNYKGSITDISVAEKQVVVTLENMPAGSYVGVGVPSYGNIRGGYTTTLGTLNLYASSTPVKQIYIANDGSINKSLDDNTINGYVLDYEQSTYANADSSYAQTAHGASAYTIGEHLVIFDPDFYLTFQGQVLERWSNIQAYAYGTQIAVAGIQNQDRYPELYLRVYNGDGTLKTGQVNLSNFSALNIYDKIDEYSHVKIVDSIQVGDTIHFLVHNGWEYAYATYNFSTNKNTVERLDRTEKTYSQFVQTNKGVKLFSADSKYYYLRDV